MDVGKAFSMAATGFKRLARGLKFNRFYNAGVHHLEPLGVDFSIWTPAEIAAVGEFVEREHEKFGLIPPRLWERRGELVEDITDRVIEKTVGKGGIYIGGNGMIASGGVLMAGDPARETFATAKLLYSDNSIVGFIGASDARFDGPNAPWQCMACASHPSYTNCRICASYVHRERHEMNLQGYRPDGLRGEDLTKPAPGAYNPEEYRSTACSARQRCIILDLGGDCPSCRATLEKIKRLCKAGEVDRIKRDIEREADAAYCRAMGITEEEALGAELLEKWVNWQMSEEDLLDMELLDLALLEDARFKTLKRMYPYSPDRAIVERFNFGEPRDWSKRPKIWAGYAKGGIVSGPTIAIAGDRGPEDSFPLVFEDATLKVSETVIPVKDVQFHPPADSLDKVAEENKQAAVLEAYNNPTEVSAEISGESSWVEDQLLSAVKGSDGCFMVPVPHEAICPINVHDTVDPKVNAVIVERPSLKPLGKPVEFLDPDHPEFKRAETERSGDQDSADQG